MSKKTQIYLASFLLPICIMLVSWIVNGFFPFGAKSLMAVDFNAQYIGLYAYMKHVMMNGDWNSVFYSFSKSIGGGMLGIWGFNLLSPFNFLYFFFNEANFQWAVMLTIGLRYGVMGVTWTHFFVKRYDGLAHQAWLLPTFASAYALNGFNVSYQMNPIFYDGMILLPLVLLGLEEYLDGGSARRYVGMLSLALVLHYYMGYMICIFVVIYACFYIVKSEKYTTFRHFFTKMCQLAGWSFLAVGLVAILLVPILTSLVSTKGGLENSLKFEWKLQIDPLDILSKLFLGAFDNDSWPAGPNLPNIYVASAGLLGTVYYFVSQKIGTKSKISAGGVLVVFLISCIHEFTSKLWHMGQNPAGFFYRFSWIIAFFLLYLAYLSLREVEQLDWKPAVTLALFMLAIFAVVVTRHYSFLLIVQKLATLSLFFLLLAILVWQNLQKRWAFIGLLTAIELCMNASIVQSRVAYTDAYKYQDAVRQLQTAVADIRPTNTEFYRINSSFNLSKNDPFMGDYPGMSIFSSNLENATRDLFEELGNNSINATTYYTGTPLTDALLSVKYLLVPKPVYTKDYPDTSKMYVFGQYVTRYDITQQTPLYSEQERTEVYQVPQTLPIAFGINDATANLTLATNQPVQNQNKIIHAMLPTQEDYFTVLAANNVTTDNFSELSTYETYRRVDPTKTASITYQLTPQTDEEYWVTLPQRFSRNDRNGIRILLNGQEYHFINNFQATQLLQVASHQQGQPLTLTIEVNNDEDYGFSGVRFYRTNRSLATQAIQERAAQGLNLTHWDNSHIQGTVTISDDSSMMYTSIPYDKGWRVLVDGKPVATTKIWESLLAFPMTSGEHTIEMTFIPDGIQLGAALTGISILILLICLRKRWAVL